MSAYNILLNITKFQILEYASSKSKPDSIQILKVSSNVTTKQTYDINIKIK